MISLILLLLFSIAQLNTTPPVSRLCNLLRQQFFAYILRSGVSRDCISRMFCSAFMLSKMGGSYICNPFDMFCNSSPTAPPLSLEDDLYADPMLSLPPTLFFFTTASNIIALTSLASASACLAFFFPIGLFPRLSSSHLVQKAENLFLSLT
jgi:hypothetical protein